MSGSAVEDIVSAHRTGLLLALCVGLNLASAHKASAEADTNPIGKVLTVEGTVRIEHCGEYRQAAGATRPPSDVGSAMI